MKKQIVLVLALVASLITACDKTTDPTPGTLPLPAPTTETVIRAIYPDAGAPGTMVAIYGDNFGPTSSYNYVTFDSEPAEITYVGLGVLNVVVPKNLAEGDYTIYLNAEGQQTSAPRAFTVTNHPY